MTARRLVRFFNLLILIGVAGYTGYLLRDTPAFTASASQNATGAAVATPSNTKVFYSLDKGQNDQELISLIDAAQKRVYFAIYEFTLTDVADALVAAKKRGLDVHGLVDATESAKSYDQPVMKELRTAGIPIETEHHADGKGIMHIKLLVTDKAYALGSYNWTYSATHENDEILEVGTDPALRQTYEDLLRRLFAKYATTSAP